MAYFFKLVDSPIGKLKLVANEAKLAAVLWEVDRPNRVKLGDMTEVASNPALDAAAQQLNEYFEGKRNQFDLELDFKGTEFQKKVWNALLTIPFGETRTYSQIARQIGHPTAVRAVGAANGRNPIAIVAPCHRVIGASGELTGFAGGLKAKEVLLTVEHGDAASRAAVIKSGTPNKRTKFATRKSVEDQLFEAEAELAQKHLGLGKA